MFQTSTALIALNSSSNIQGILQQLGQMKVQVINKTQINTKENILFDLENVKPNFLLVFSGLPGVVGLNEIITKVKQISPRTKVILTINENDTSKILNYLASNVDAILWSDNILDSLEGALKQLTKGLTFICGRSAYELRASLQEQKAEIKFDLGLLDLLTDRETEVLYSLTQGVNYKQISKLLFISESTVKTHINNIFTKLNVNDRTQAVLYALHHGIENISKKPDLLKTIVNEPVKK